MYKTSEKYKDYIKRDTRHYELELILRTTQGAEYIFSNEDILKGSFNLVKQCCSNQEIEIGTVYTSEMSVSIFSSIDRYSLFDAVVYPYFILKMDGLKEKIPLGVFTIKDPNRKISCIELVGYDNMMKFDKSFSNFTSIGKPFDFLTLACEACGLKFANTKEQIELLPNGKETLSIYEDNDIENWRDVIHYITQILGAVAFINREGNLDVFSYGNEPVATIKQKERFSSSYSDFTTRFTGVRGSNIRTGKSEYVSLETDDALTMNIGANPFLQYGTEEQFTSRLTAILNSISLIEYIPFSANIISDPSLDCGDIVKFVEGHADDDGIYCLTTINFNYGKDFNVSCSGKNPLLSEAKSKTDKNIQGLINSSSKNELISYNFTNAKSLSIGSVINEIIAIMFVSKKNASVEFKASIIYKLECETSAEVRFTYEVDDNKVNTHIPIETKTSGNHLTTLFYPISEVKENQDHKFRVLMDVVGGNVSIEKFGIIANLNGQGLVSNVVPWDGKLNFEDIFDEITIDTIHDNGIEFDFIDSGPMFKLINNQIVFNMNFTVIQIEINDNTIIMSNLIDEVIIDENVV